jgi:hypothetical protein
VLFTSASYNPYNQVLVPELSRERDRGLVGPNIFVKVAVGHTAPGLGESDVKMLVCKMGRLKMREVGVLPLVFMRFAQDVDLLVPQLLASWTRR